MKSLQNKRGSFTVFVTMLFAAVLILVAAVIWAAGQMAISSTTETFGRLWGRSILAEFDSKLKERYGLFGYYGNEFLVREKLTFYADYSFKDKEYINFGDIECYLAEYSLNDPENIKKQIKEVVASGTSPIPIVLPETDMSSGENRYINSRWIIDALPSEGHQGSVGVYGLIEKLKGAKNFSSLVLEVAEDIYIFRFFKDYSDSRNLGETYFNNEIEYIITGQLNDRKAREKVYNNLVVIRNGLNLLYLYSCEEKRQAVMTVAELIAPGAPALAVQAIIMEAWALMEARNDLELLYIKKPVPIIKGDQNWALSLENVLAGMEVSEENGVHINQTRKGYKLPQSEEGICYEDYLKILVGALPEKIKLLRVMDLIQINMKYLYCDYFVLDDYYSALDFSMEVNGRTYEFKEEY